MLHTLGNNPGNRIDPTGLASLGGVGLPCSKRGVHLSRRSAVDIVWDPAAKHGKYSIHSFSVSKCGNADGRRRWLCANAWASNTGFHTIMVNMTSESL